VPGTGGTLDNQRRVRCGYLSGSYYTKVIHAIETANPSTPWREGETLYRLVLRPLLPYEAACDQTQSA
jgi:hypothetical protein